MTATSDSDKTLAIGSDSDKGLSLSGDETWQTIIDRLTTNLDKEDLPDDVVRVTELLLSGYPVSQSAKKAGVSTATVRRWLSMYPTMAVVLSDGRRLLSKWRMAKLEQQFLQAIEKSDEILNLKLDGSNPKDGEPSADPKILTVVAAQSRYIIGLFSGQRIDVQVTHELGETTLKARKDALDYLAEQLKTQRDESYLEPIEAVYRVEDAKFDNSGPMLTETGEPYHGEFGKISQDADGADICHICGGHYKSLAKHVLTLHGINTTDYETLFMLEEGSLKKSETRPLEKEDDDTTKT
jgi:predicted transcriptional regulator